jgi:hypothetical protein
MPARDDAAEVRAWAVAQDLLDAGGTGRMPQAVYDTYDARDQEPVHGRVTVDRLPGESDDDFMARVDAVAEAGPPPGAAPPPPRPRAERKPRDVPGSRPPRAGWRPGFLGGPRAAPGGKRKRREKPPRVTTANRPRVSLDELISAGWRGAAGVVAPMLPATARMMKLQSPVVGVVLDPVVKGTLVDTFLQPLARTSETAEAMAVILLPPVLVGLMESDPRRATVMMPMLRFCMLRWHKVAGPAMADALRRETDFEADWGQTVDEMIGLLGMTFDTPEDEEAAVFDAQQHMADRYPPESEPDSDLEPPPAPFTPAQAARQAAEAMPRPEQQGGGPVPPGLHLDPRLAPVPT